MTTTYSAGQAKAMTDILQTPDAVPLEEPVGVGTILSLAEEVSHARAERDELLERLRAIRQTVADHLHEPTPRGELARDVEAEADPHPEPDTT